MTSDKPKRQATHISLSGEAEQHLKALKAKLGGNFPQIVKQALKMMYDFYFPQPVSPPPPDPR